MNDEAYLRMAIARSRESVEEGRFSAGAIVMADYLGDPPIVSGISSNATDFRHAEVHAIETAIELVEKNLEGAVLYASMEPCFMCLATAYWAGIRKIVYAIRRSQVDQSYYEGTITASQLNESFHERLELVHLATLEGIALDVVREWEKAH
jgi:guanine deaminase